MSPRGPVLLLALLVAWPALARPPGPATVCATYPSAPACVGQQPACTLCHVAAPQLNAFGQQVQGWLVPAAPRPLSDGDFALALPAALRAVEGLDADGDGATNLLELQGGTLPGDATSAPGGTPCVGGDNPAYAVCRYDSRYVYRKLLLDFCGASPTWEQLRAFTARAEADRPAVLDAELDRCLKSEFWLGKNGQLWRLAHAKVRPVGSLKSGEDQGQIPLADYYDDYALFAYTHSGDRDVREVLTATYFVRRDVAPTRYTAVSSLPTQAVDVAHRAGVMSSTWSLVYFVMFTALPRNAAAQMYRAYLGLDIARQEGLYSVPGEPRDYDAKGVTATACAACHATLDPLSYPFRNYNGITFNADFARYVPRRLETYFADLTPTITSIPEQGVLLGQPVADLKAWARVAADSDAFAIATVGDFWRFLLGHPPRPEENADFVALWRGLKTSHAYRVEKMLHALIKTEAYGAP